MEVNIDAIVEVLSRVVPEFQVPIIELVEAQTHDPFKILVATILSARTKDETTSAVCRKLFKVVDTVADLENIPEEELVPLLHPVGFYKTKAKNLKKLPGVLKEEFNGIIPQTVDELVKLPGVGRKTANLVSAVAFDQDAICVDTHVHRIMNRFGYITTETPFETEMTLREKLPVKYWKKINYLLVAFGQNHCHPISPKCSTCPIAEYCGRINVKTSR
jgi:endonuclease III